LNSGGEPERDDTGLPPVDIEIPDDARELDRDVQAYYRERRAFRRQQRRSRLHGFLAKDGIVLPLLACCLILALITGTLLTVFTAASDQGFPTTLPGTGGHPSSTGGASAGPAGTGAPSTGPAGTGAPSTGARRPASATPGAGSRAGPATPILLPTTTTMRVHGKPVTLRSLSRVLLVLVPPGCPSCTAAVTALARLAAAAHAPAYLVGAPSQATGIAQLAGQVSHRTGARITVAVDTSNALARYRDGLTAILIGPHHAAALAGHLVLRENLDRLRPALTG
jgi:hypothetical protein